jgi:hypothetical protein
MVFQSKYEHEVGGYGIKAGRLETIRLARALAKDNDGGICAICGISSIMNDRC